jgi:hypothetical protein
VPLATKSLDSKSSKVLCKDTADIPVRELREMLQSRIMALPCSR